MRANVRLARSPSWDRAVPCPFAANAIHYRTYFHARGTLLHLCVLSGEYAGTAMAQTPKTPPRVRRKPPSRAPRTRRIPLSTRFHRRLGFLPPVSLNAAVGEPGGHGWRVRVARLRRDLRSTPTRPQIVRVLSGVKLGLTLNRILFFCSFSVRFDPISKANLGWI